MATNNVPNDVAGRLLDLAGESRRLIQAARERGFRTETKADNSFVTSVDLAVELRLRELIAAWYPDHGVLGEEQAPRNPGAEYQWILDPVDGTEEFVRDIPTYGTIIALHHRGVPLAGVLDFPALDLRVHAVQGQGCFRNGTRVSPPAESGAQADAAVCLSARGNFARHHDDGGIFDAVTRAFPNHRIYRSCLNHALAATGEIDAAVAWHERAWDLAAAPILVTEAGGRYETVRTRPLADGGIVFSAVFGRRGVVERILPIVN